MNPVIFDMDGVLVQTERMHYEALNCALERACGRRMAWTYYSQFVGASAPHMWRVLDRDFALCGRTDAIARDYAANKQAFLARDGHVPVDGAPALVRALHAAGVPLAVASSSPMGEIEAAVAALGLTGCFHVLLSGETVAHPKPAPDIFLCAAARLGAAPSVCRVVEDSANGVRAAKAAGMFCIGLVNPDSGVQDLSAADVRTARLDDAVLQLCLGRA